MKTLKASLIREKYSWSDLFYHIRLNKHTHKDDQICNASSYACPYNPQVHLIGGDEVITPYWMKQSRNDLTLKSYILFTKVDQKLGLTFMKAIKIKPWQRRISIILSVLTHLFIPIVIQKNSLDLTDANNHDDKYHAHDESASI